MADLDEYKTLAVTLHVLARYGVEVEQRGGGYFAACPMHLEDTASFHVMESGRFKCFGCGAAGTAIDLVAHFEGIHPPALVIPKLADLLPAVQTQSKATRPPSSSKKRKVTQRQEMKIAVARSLLPIIRSMENEIAHPHRYWERRGIPSTAAFLCGFSFIMRGDALAEWAVASFGEDTCRLVGLLSSSGSWIWKHHPVVIPATDGEGELYGLQFRATGAAEPRFLSLAAGGLINGGALSQREQRPLVVCEGAADTASLWLEGHRAVGLMGLTTWEGVIPMIERASLPYVVLAFDRPDGVENEQAGKLARRLAPVRCERAIPPHPYKDWNEALVGGATLSHLVTEKIEVE